MTTTETEVHWKIHKKQTEWDMTKKGKSKSLPRFSNHSSRKWHWEKGMFHAPLNENRRNTQTPHPGHYSRLLLFIYVSHSHPPKRIVVFCFIGPDHAYKRREQPPALSQVQPHARCSCSAPRQSTTSQCLTPHTMYWTNTPFCSHLGTTVAVASTVFLTFFFLYVPPCL